MQSEYRQCVRLCEILELLPFGQWTRKADTLETRMVKLQISLQSSQKTAVHQSERESTIAGTAVEETTILPVTTYTVNLFVSTLSGNLVQQYSGRTMENPEASKITDREDNPDDPVVHLYRFLCERLSKSQHAQRKKTGVPDMYERPMPITPEAIQRDVAEGKAALSTIVCD